MICQNCNSEIPEGASECPVCGVPVGFGTSPIFDIPINPNLETNNDDTGATVATPQSLLRAQQNHNQSNAQFNNAPPVQPAPPVPPVTPPSYNPAVENVGFATPPQQPKKSNKGVLIGAVAAVVVVAIIAAVTVFLVLNRSNDSDTNEASITQQIEQKHFNIEINGIDDAGDENIVDSLSSDQRRLANQFVSNFAEIGFKDFDVNESNADQIINFSMTRCYVNNKYNIKISGSGSSERATLDAKYVTGDAERFFDCKISNGSTSFVNYNGSKKTYSAKTSDIIGNVPVPYEVGFNSFSSCASVTEMYEKTDGTYIVNFNVFISTNGTLSKNYYSEPASALENNPNLKLVAVGTAQIRDWYDKDGQNKYQLIQYKTEMLYGEEEVNSSSITSPFYGILCAAYKTEDEALDYANTLKDNGFEGASVVVTTDWSNLNNEKWYVVTADTYQTKSDAKSELDRVKEICPNAYIKHSGDWIG